MMAACAIPGLPARLPTEFRTNGSNRISAPLALAMLQGGLIHDDHLHAGGNEQTLVELALGRWWSEKTAPLQLFKWNLHIQIIEHYYTEQTSQPVFCMTVQNSDIPQRSLALRVGELEAEHVGFGQTVVAVLYDCLRYLPETWAPRNIMSMAEQVYWGGRSDENGWFEDHVGHGEYASREAFLADIGQESLVTRAELLDGIPNWLPSAKRVCRREDLERAARSPLSKNVIAACDRIHALVHSAVFSLKPFDFTVDVEVDGTEACLFLRWDEADSMVRVLDDYMHGAYESGEYLECIAATRVPSAPHNVRDYINRAETMLLLAKAAEDLLLLISTPIPGDPS